MSGSRFITTFDIREMEEAASSNTASLLPATHRTKQDHIVVPQPNIEFLEKELLVSRINEVQDWLWLCGRPRPPRPLHFQRLLQRNIIITENPELHMVWSVKEMFIKPMPPYLLDQDFWETYILPSSNDRRNVKANTEFPPMNEELQRNDRRKARLAACARGFLFSYTALIAYESDFRIAMMAGLLPSGTSWTAWQTITSDILAEHDYSTVSARFRYGELRLSRLNKVFQFRNGQLIRRFSNIRTPTTYLEFVQEHSAFLGTVLAYIVIVLTAMQVGLAIDQLQISQEFQSVVYGFTVFSMIAPLVIGVTVVLLAAIVLAYNWFATNDYEKKRFREMGVERKMTEVEKQERRSGVV
jgi:hypothetical protein